MNLDTVITELSTAAKTITGLRVLPWAAKTVTPPSLIFGLPESISPNETYGRGVMKISDLPLILLVGAPTARTSLRTLSAYCAGSGAKSLTAALQNYSGYAQVQAITVQRIELDAVKVAGIEYLGAIFHTDVVGSGTT